MSNMIGSAGVEVIKKKVYAVLSAIICAAALSGCSLFDLSEEPANVYIPAGTDTPRPTVSSSTVKDENQYDGFLKPSTSSSESSSSTSNPTVTTIPEETMLSVSESELRNKWYYFHISDKCQAVYRRLYNCVLNEGEGCDVSDLNVTYQEVYEAFWAFDYENPQFLQLGNGYELTMIDPKISNKVKSIKISYSRLPSEAMQTEFETRAEPVLEAARALDSDYERLKYVHDWIVNNTVYTKSGAEYESEADGPVVYGQALCEGYSKAFMYFAQQLGYPCICSVGVANLEDHMWNMVKIGNKWYNVDVTWDDPVSPDGEQVLRHDYFLICDAELRLDHRVERPNMLPTSDYGYFPHGYDQDATIDNGQVTIEN